MKRLITVLVALALFAAACASSNSSIDTASTQTQTEPADATTDETPTPTPTTAETPTPTTVAEPPVAACTVPDGTPGTSPTDQLVAGFSDIGFDLLRSQSVESNAVLSPASIGHALLMLRPAADDESGAAIDEALSLPEGLAAHEAWRQIDQQILEANRTVPRGEPVNPVVTFADRIWPTQLANLDQEWVDILATYHRSDLEPIDISQPEASRATINDWVGSQTQELIPELLPPGSLERDTSMVLTDALYFEASWQSWFSEDSGVFQLVDGTLVRTPTIEASSPVWGTGSAWPALYAEGDGWVASSVPYDGEDFSMLLVVPDTGRFDEIRAGLCSEFISEVDDALTLEHYSIELPKWQSSTAIDLAPWLDEIGAKPGAYPGVGSNSRLSQGYHGADIAVDELGTVAAAATALISIEVSAGRGRDFNLEIDRPFFYLIRHDDTGLVLFAGQVVDPRPEAAD